MKSKGCRRKRISISAYLDGELSRRGRLKIEAHLRVCRECSEYLKEIRAVSERVQMLPRLEPNHEAVIRLKRAVRISTAGERKRLVSILGLAGQPRWAFAAAAASVLIMAVILFNVTPSGQQPEIASKVSSETGLTAGLSDSPVDRADSDLQQAKQRLLAELSWENESADGVSSERDSLRASFASHEFGGETSGRVVHSVDFGSSYVRRPPVSSHILYVTYGN